MLRLRVISALGTLGLLTISNSASASPDRAAQQLFRAGVEAARQERWVDARMAFEKAYRLSARPVVLINLAGAQARTGHLLEAARNYRQILEDHHSAETATFRKAAADILPELQARIPRIQLRPPDFAATDVVEIDGNEVYPGGFAEPQPLDPGAHSLVVTRAGVERVRIGFSLAERETHNFSLAVALPPLALASAPSSTPPSGLSLASPSAPPAEPSHRSWLRSPRTWVAVAAVALAATGLTAWLIERGDQIVSGNIPPGVVSVK